MGEVRTKADVAAIEEGMERAITLRALLLSALLTPLNSIWLVYTEIVRYAGHPTTTSLYFNVIFTITCLIALNALIRRIKPSLALTQGELLVIYTLLSLSSCMVGHDMYQVLIACLVHPFWFASPENGWEWLFFDALPKWMMVSDKEVLRGYMLGGDMLYKAQYIRAWMPIILLWTGFFMVLLVAMMCLNVLLRKRWTEQERLSFPICYVPMEITRSGSAIFLSQRFWGGFALSSFIDVLNNLAENFPSVPRINIRTIFLNQYVTARPWNAIGWTPFAFFPFIVGITYFLPLDLSFSCFFFYWFWKAQRIITAFFGWDAYRPLMPYINEQSSGAYLGVAAFVFWIARGYFKEVLKRVIGIPSNADDHGEPMSYRAAVIMFVICFIISVLFWVAGGMTPAIAVVFFIIYFCLSIAVTRMRAELGSPAHDLHFAGPDQIITRALGSQLIQKRTLAAFAITWGFNRAYRSHPMPHQLEGFKLARDIGYNYRKLMYAMLAFGLWGSLCAFWALLDVYYRLGAASAKIVGPSVWFGWEPYNRLASLLRAPTKPDNVGTAFVIVGFVFTMFLMSLRGMFSFMPFHPVGLAVSSSWAMNWMWGAIMLGWIVKAAILHFGGLQAMKSWTPFFIGLIMGEYIVGSICNIMGIIRNWKIYRFWG
ncbi:MAG: hypothetical protein GDYSWBUE_000323 [Candidatus Fervidibacterota bacterium]